MIFCKDCKFLGRWFSCDAPQNVASPSINPVTGRTDQVQRHRSALPCRQSLDEDACGPEASWFQPKEPT